MKNTVSRKAHTHISRILWGQWDPMGVHDDPKAWGKYDPYVRGIYALLVGGASDDELSQYLLNRETQDMGLSGSSSAHLATVVAALRAVCFEPAEAP